MNYNMARYVLGQLALILATCLLLPFVIALVNMESGTPIAFGSVILGLIAVGVPNAIIKPKNRQLRPRCGIAIVALSWLGISIIGALPFFISGYIPDFIDALFETVSGLTTTGSSILTNIEALPNSLLLWRSFTHWIGGMGVLVLAIALLPKNDPATVHLMKAEVPGPQFGKLVSKLRFTARILYSIYIVLTLLNIIALLLCGMNLFDSVIHALGTAGTGGFSNKNLSVAHFDSVAVDIVLTVFMMIFSINFNLFYFVLIGNIKDAIKSEELRVLLTIFLVSIIAITISLVINNVYTIWDSLRYGAFQVSAVISTTGYATADWSTWPTFCQAILFILMFIGGSAGSTAGGLKVYRVIILSKLGFNAIKKTFSPRSYLTARMDGKAVDENLVKSITGYFMTYVLTFLCSFLLLSLASGEIEGGLLTNLSAVTTCFNNVGPGLGSLIGPSGNFASYNPISKIILIMDMLLGRLEIFPMLILFTPLAWKKMKTDCVEQNA